MLANKSDNSKKGDPLLRLIENIVLMDDQKWEIGSADKFAQLFSDYYNNGGINKYSVTYQWVQRTNPGNYEYLFQRTEDIKNVLEEKNYDCIPKFNKLVDYINLEISRAENVKELKKRTLVAQKSLKKVEEIASQVKDDETKLKNELLEEKKSSNAQAITVLSIFTGIVMSFFGGFKLFEEAVGNLTTKNDYKLIFIISFIGFIFFNSIFILIYAASKIGNNKIYSCKYGQCRDADGNITCNRKKSFFSFLSKEQKTCGFFGKILHGYSFVLLVNIVIILVMIASGTLYYISFNY